MRGRRAILVIANPALPPYTLHDGPIAGRAIAIAAYQLEVLEPEPVTILLEPDLAARFAFVAVAVAPPGGAEKHFSLAAGEPRVWRCFRASVFEPLRWRYRIDYVAYSPNGTTLPLQSTTWADAEGSELLVRPPAP